MTLAKNYSIGLISEREVSQLQKKESLLASEIRRDLKSLVDALDTVDNEALCIKSTSALLSVYSKLLRKTRYLLNVKTEIRYRGIAYNTTEELSSKLSEIALSG